MKTILLSVALLINTAQWIHAAAPVEARIILRGPMLVGFFPPVTQADLDDHMGGAAEGMAHVEFALENGEKCLSDSGILAATEFVQAHSILIEEQGRLRRHKLPAEYSRAVGVYLLKPGAADLPVYAEGGPSSLLARVPAAAGKYFRALQCK